MRLVPESWCLTLNGSCCERRLRLTYFGPFARLFPDEVRVEDCATEHHDQSGSRERGWLGTRVRPHFGFWPSVNCTRTPAGCELPTVTEWRSGATERDRTHWRPDADSRRVVNDALSYAELAEDDLTRGPRRTQESAADLQLLPLVDLDRQEHLLQKTTAVEPVTRPCIATRQTWRASILGARDLLLSRLPRGV